MSKEEEYLADLDLVRHVQQKCLPKVQFFVSVQFLYRDEADVSSRSKNSLDFNSRKNIQGRIWKLRKFARKKKAFIIYLCEIYGRSSRQKTE
jgi:hypothetical protein